MSDNSDLDGKSPFQIRDFPNATRRLAKNCAGRAGLNVPEWMDLAVHTQARVDAGEQVLPPDGGASAGAMDDRLTARMQAVAAMMQGLAAVKSSTGRATGRDVVAQALWGLSNSLVQIEGAPRRAHERPLPVIDQDGAPRLMIRPAAE